MRVEQAVLKRGDTLQALDGLRAIKPGLVLVFGAIELLKEYASSIANLFPGVIRIGCSTAGEISGQGVTDDTCVVTAIHLDAVSLVEASTRLVDMADSQAAGVRLSRQLPLPGLRAVMVLGQGVAINGSALIAGMVESLGASIPITGGLAGDAAAFSQTWVLGSNGLHSDTVVCVGLYGAALSFKHGSFGGWAPFGPARKVTRCDVNVLFELDGAPALEVYKRYLGDHAAGLPASGLLFPFAMLGKDHNEVGLIRTILAVDEAQGSLTLAGDIDPDGYLRLMHASTDALVDGAQSAAQAAAGRVSSDTPHLALLVSCVGRKLVMGGRVDEEVEAVADVFGRQATLTGFYSNGEISPLTGGADCKLHNQTMTITMIGEA